MLLMRDLEGAAPRQLGRPRMDGAGAPVPGHDLGNARVRDADHLGDVADLEAPLVELQDALPVEHAQRAARVVRSAELVSGCKL